MIIPIMMPIPMPMYGGGMTVNNRVDTSGMESKLGSINSTLKRMEDAISKDKISVQVVAGDIAAMVSAVYHYGVAVTDKQRQLEQALWPRLKKVRDWQRPRKQAREKRREIERYVKYVEEAQEELSEALNRAKQKHAAQKRSWFSFPTPLVEFEKEEGVKKLQTTLDVWANALSEKRSGKRSDVDYWMESESLLINFETERLYDNLVFNRLAPKHPITSSLSEIGDLHEICQVAPGATINVPSNLMRVIAETARETTVELIS